MELGRLVYARTEIGWLTNSRSAVTLLAMVGERLSSCKTFPVHEKAVQSKAAGKEFVPNTLDPDNATEMPRDQTFGHELLIASSSGTSPEMQKLVQCDVFVGVTVGKTKFTLHDFVFW